MMLVDGGWWMVDGGWRMVERQNKSRAKQVETKKSQIFAKVFKLGEMAGGNFQHRNGVSKSQVLRFVCPNLRGAIDEIALSAGVRGLPPRHKTIALIFRQKNRLNSSGADLWKAR